MTDGNGAEVSVPVFHEVVDSVWLSEVCSK